MPASLLPNKAFTIIEVIIATFILTVGVLGVFSTIQTILVLTRDISSQLQATYLAQGGIENTRNIRDSNWLENRYAPTPWDDGIPSGTWLPETIGKFARQITITKPQPNEIVISVQVSWVEGSSTRQVVAATELYDWR